MGEHLAARNSVGFYLAVMGVCAATGMVGLPLVFDVAGAASWMTILWLVAAGVVSVVALFVVRSLSNALVAAFESPLTPSQSLLLARLVTLGIALIITQASVRRPVALLIGGPLEAPIAAVSLAIVMALLVWAFQTAQPLVEALTLRTLDAAIPTVQPQLAAEPTHTMSVADIRPTPSDIDAATVRVAREADDAPTLRTPAHDEPTLRTPVNDDPTLRTPSADPDATARFPHPPRAQPE